MTLLDFIFLSAKRGRRMEAEFARLELEAMRAVYQRQSVGPEAAVTPEMHAQLDAALREYVEFDEAERIAGMAPRFLQICSACQLTAFEVDVLLLAIAPVWNPEIEEAYAALSDREYRGLTPGIVGRIFAARAIALNSDGAESAQDAGSESAGYVAALYRALAPDSALLRYRLIRWLEQDAALHAARFAADARIVHYLQGSDGASVRLQGLVQLRFPLASEAESTASLAADLPERAVSELRSLATTWQAERSAVAEAGDVGAARPTLLQVHGPARNGQREAAAFFAQELQLPLLYIEAGQLAQASSQPQSHSTEVRELLREITREALLYDAIVCVVGGADFHQNDAGRDWLRDELPLLPAPAILETREPALAVNSTDTTLRVWELALPALNNSERRAVWEESIACSGSGAEHRFADDIALSAFANGFRFTAQQTRAAVQRAVDRALITAEGTVNRKLLLEACYAESNRDLSDLAVRVRSRPAWSDLVLRPEAQRQLGELCDQARHSGRVHHEWGFARGEGDAVGLHALFAGAPGTGKTMAAAVVASELGLEMYRIELSAVVSKYIGETEKNLARIFAEAETSNAVLFFDEADALFGKRGEVKDAQDRYANMEVSYLLQKMEEYPGITILATNFRANLDKAFVRRLNFIIDFPFPDVNERLEIWARNFPARAPLATDVDLAVLAARLDVPGALIRNIARGAAFLAAAEDSSIGLRHIRRAAAREYKKDRRPVPDFSTELSVNGSPANL